MRGYTHTCVYKAHNLLNMKIYNDINLLKTT